MSNPLTVVGCGYTGRRILNLVPSARGISRSLPDGIPENRVLLADLDRDIAPIKLEGAVIYTVAPDASGARLERFLNALESPPVRIVYLSTTGVYGDRGGERVVESDPVRPQSGRAQRRVAAEQRLVACPGELVILRVPGIYGPDRLGLEKLRDGTPLVREADLGPGNRIHVDDLAAICVRAAEPDAPVGVFNVGDGDHRSSTAFAKLVADRAGLPPPPEITLSEARDTFSAMRLSFLEESRLVDTSRLAQLGVELRYPNVEDGIRASVAVGSRLRANRD